MKGSNLAIFEDDDIEAKLLLYIFKSLKFEYSPMSGHITGYDYQKLKDSLKWNGLSVKSYISLIDAMFSNFTRNIEK